MMQRLRQHGFFLATLLMVGWLGVAGAHAQVRSEPEGNHLPSTAPPTGQVMQELQAGQVPHDAVHAGMDTPAPMALLSAQQRQRLAAGLHLERFGLLAAFDGRAKIIDTLAREQLEKLYGKPGWKDLSDARAGREDPVFTYLDLLFEPAYYLDKPLIYVEVLPLREQMLWALGMKGAELETWKRRGRITPAMFMDPRMGPVLQAVDLDAAMLKGRNQMFTAWETWQTLPQTLVLLPPMSQASTPSHVTSMTPSPLARATPRPLGPDMATNGQWHTLAPDAATPEEKPVVEAFTQLRDAWLAGDVSAANTALDRLCDLLPALNPPAYPSLWQRRMERVYNLTHRFTIGYAAYALAALVLLMSLGMAAKWVARAGVALLLTGAALHLAGILVRAILAHRWPIHNQYESFIAISFFGVLVGIVLLFVRRQTWFGAAAAALGALCLLFANTVDIPSSDVAPVAGILATSRILYLHVNMVLASYALIALGFFMSVFYLAAHYLRRPGAGGEPSSPAVLLADLDRAQMVVLQLAFWILGVGIMLGAYWADHAWGRWWGWDPKETWALITWIIYLIVIHLRLAVKQRGLVTAWLSVVGFFVMLWTYWGVNLLLAGLHSYA